MILIEYGKCYIMTLKASKSPSKLNSSCLNPSAGNNKITFSLTLKKLDLLASTPSKFKK